MPKIILKVNTKVKSFRIIKRPLKSKIFNSSLRDLILLVRLNRIIATESLRRPSPNIMEWILGNLFFLTTDKTETVSVAVKVADKRRTY